MKSPGRHEGRMLEWLKRRGWTAPSEARPEVDATTRHGSRKAGRYRLLYEYLQHRYANTVAPTFGQIEDLPFERVS